MITTPDGFFGKKLTLADKEKSPLIRGLEIDEY
jgi:hypothetical protein